MRHLKVVGLTEDRTRLLLVGADGEEFSVAADDSLTAALRRPARLGQLEITMDSSLRPRDIQARIRAGESPEAVASAAGVDVEKIRGFAMPVMAERAHVAQRAQAATVRRRAASENAARTLGDAVAERLSARGVDLEGLGWDAWRRPDGRWALVADYRSGDNPRHAEFTYDAPGHYVTADDDEARWLVGEPSGLTGPQPRAAGTGTGRRLSAVASLGEQELPLGDDAIALVREPAGDEDTVDLPYTSVGDAGVGIEEDHEPAATARRDAASDLAPSERVHGPEDQALPGVAEQVDEQLDEQQDDVEPAQVPEQAAHLEQGRSVDDPGATDAGAAEAGAAEAGATEGGSSETEDGTAKPRRSGRKRRASVPSWDEIMFGGGSSD